MSVQLVPYIMLEGSAKEAMNFYEQHLDAHILSQHTMGDAPPGSEPPIPEEASGYIAHAVLKIADSFLFVADVLPGQQQVTGNKLTLCISTDNAEIARKYYDALQQEGHVEVPLQKTYFSPAYGMVTDKFGVTFQIFTTMS